MHIIMQIIGTIGFATTAVCLIHIGKKLQILSDLQETVNKIKSNLSVISYALTSSPNVDFDHGRLQACSPLQLTEDGGKFLNEIGFVKLFEEHSDDFYKCIDAENPLERYSD